MTTAEASYRRQVTQDGNDDFVAITCSGCGEPIPDLCECLPPITCGMELADGTLCERPSLHEGDHTDRPYLGFARVLLRAIIADG